MRTRRLGAVIGVAATALAAMTFTNVRASSPAPPVFVNGALPPAPASGTTVNNDDEPGIAVTPDGVFWATSNSSDARRAETLRGNDVWRSVDGGQTYEWVAAPFNLVADQGGFGGGDGDIAVAPERNALGNYNIYVTGLWFLPSFTPVLMGDVSLAISQDNGASWIVDPVAAPLPADDRPWVAADGPCTVYLNYHAGPTVANVVDKYDLCDPAALVTGNTITPITSTRYPELAPSAAVDAPATYVTVGFNKPAVDTNATSPYAHRVYIPMMDCPGLTLEQEIGRAEAAQGDCPDGYTAEVSALVSADGGTTWTLQHVADSSNRHVAVWPVAAAVGDAGVVYLVWSDERHVYLAVSDDGGSTWTSSGQVDAPTATSLFPAIATASGVVEVAWYGTDVGGEPMDATVMGAPGSPAGAAWRVVWARSTDGGATWTQTTASDVIHTGLVCPNGSACTIPGSRSLLDDFGIAGSPVTGRASIAYTTDAVGGRSWFATEQP
jgi:hypothetical protein